MISELTQWLTSFGLEQYVDAFEDNAIETALLPELTDDDLKTLGVEALGHRKRILKAIAGYVRLKLFSGHGSEVDKVPASGHERLSRLYQNWSRPICGIFLSLLFPVEPYLCSIIPVRLLG